ncbi:MAG: PD-(D/E)XK nuclease family protein [Acidobacteria bacterium]|nr:PD-(D/E)XK nuclease family protein [Acidobacteriota bacterium]
MSAATILRKVIESKPEGGTARPGDTLGYIQPSSLSRGCLLYVARELLKTPKPELDNQAKRILESGVASRNRTAKYFADLTAARELPFVDREYRIRGQCDALIYIPPSMSAERTGFYVVEIKTVKALEYDQLKHEGQPREEHMLQCLIYIWGIRRYYRVISPPGGILYYENRDTLDYLLFDVEYDEARLTPLLDQVKQVLADVRQGRLPEHQQPVEHCSYCAYLEICDVGQRAVAQRKQEGSAVPDYVLAKIIAERIVNKKKLQQSKRQAPRSLEELSSQLGWNKD